MGALDTAVRSGKARYVGISSYGPEMTETAADILRTLGTPLLIHQPSYSMLNRWIEDGLLDVLGAGRHRCDHLLAAGPGPVDRPLPERRRGGLPCAPRALLLRGFVTPENLERVRALNEIAGRRGQTLAQLAIAWALRDPRVTSVLLGASRVEQLEQNVAALENLDFDSDVLEEIDRYAQDGGINLWPPSS